MSSLCGCYYYVPSTGNYKRSIMHYLPLLDSEAHIIILSTTSRTVLKQTFTNSSPEEAIKECAYTFPLYDGVSVVSFACTIGSKVLRGLVKEKVKANEIFNRAVAQGETAGLFEQAAQASDIFSTKLGNIPASTSVIVEITYVGELKHHETNGIRFTIPTSIAPRYVGAGPADFAVLNNVPVQDNSGIKITVDVHMPEGSFIKAVQSPSHPIAVSIGTLSTAPEADPLMSKASATLSLGSAALEKDFVLIVQSKDIGTPKAILEAHPTIPNHRAVMATLVPKFSLPPSRPEMVFVADRSGSMSSNIPMLISAMKVFLKSMPVGVKFNICSFGSSASFLWPQSKSYSNKTLQQATAYVETFDAGMGGTETFNAIKATIKQRFKDLPLEIIILTDGDIWQQGKLLEYVNEQVKKSDGKIRVFPLGIGNGVSHSLIEGLARAGNGFAQTVQHGERLDNCVVRMLRGALSPHITDYTLEVKYEKDDDDFEVIEKVTEGMKVLLSDSEALTSTQKTSEMPTISLFDRNANPEKEDIKLIDAEPQLPNIPHPKLLQAPHKIPNLYAFSRTTVYLLMSPETIQRNPTSVVLRATSIHGTLALEIPIEVLSAPGETIHQLAAKKAVQDLEEGRGWIFDAKDQAGALVKERFPSSFDDLVKKEAVRLGEKFQVAGKWCSFVAVSENDAEISAKRMKDSSGYNLSDFYFDLALPGEAECEDLAGCEDYGVVERCSLPVSTTDLMDSTTSRSNNLKYRCFRQVAARQKPASKGRPMPMRRRLGHLSGSVQHSQSSLKMQDIMANGDSVPQERMGRSSVQVPGPMPLVQADSAISQFDCISVNGRDKDENYTCSQSGQATFNVTSGTGGTAGPYYCGVEGSSTNAPPPSSTWQAASSGQAQGLARQFYRTHSTNNSVTAAAVSFVKGSVSFFNPRSVTSKRALDRSQALCERAAGPAVFETLSGESLEAETVPSEVDCTPNWASKSATEKVLHLISLQDFEGYWHEDDKEIPVILGFEIPKMPAPTANGRIWMTLLVVCFLEVKNGDEEGTWGLVVEKARGWLACNVTKGLKDLEKQAESIVMECSVDVTGG